MFRWPRFERANLVPAAKSENAGSGLDSLFEFLPNAINNTHHSRLESRTTFGHLASQFEVSNSRSRIRTSRTEVKKLFEANHNKLLRVDFVIDYVTISKPWTQIVTVTDVCSTSRHTLTAVSSSKAMPTIYWLRSSERLSRRAGELRTPRALGACAIKLNSVCHRAVN